MYRRIQLLGSVFTRARAQAIASKAAVTPTGVMRTVEVAAMPVLSTPTRVSVPDTAMTPPAIPPPALPTQVVMAPPMQAPYSPPTSGGSYAAPAAASDGPSPAAQAATGGGMPGWVLPVGIVAAAALFMSHRRGG